MATPNSTPQPRPSHLEPPPLMGRGGPVSGGPRMMGMMGKGERPKDRRGVLMRLWGYLRRQKWGLIGAGLMVTAAAMLNLVGPYLLGVAIDDYIIPGDLVGLSRLALVMLAIYVVAAFFTWGQTYVMVGVAQRTIRDLRNDLFAKLQTLDLRYFDQNPHGDLMSRLTNDVENISTVLSESLAHLVSGALTLVAVTLLMLWLNPWLAAVTLTIVPLLMVLVSRWLASRTAKAFAASRPPWVRSMG